MRILIILFFILQKYILLPNYYSPERKTKCISPNQKLNLKINPINPPTNGFTIMLYIRSTFYHNEISKPFLKFTNKFSNQELILTSTKGLNNTYEVKYLSNLLGEIIYSNTNLNTFEENDLINSTFSYSNWHFLGISFYNNSFSIFFDDIFNTFNINYTFDLNDLVFFDCLSVNSENLGGLYFSDILVFNS